MPHRLTEAFDDPLMPDAVTMCDLIDKAQYGKPFERSDYPWLYALLADLWESHEFRLRLRLYAVEMELNALRKATKEKTPT